MMQRVMQFFSSADSLSPAMPHPLVKAAEIGTIEDLRAVLLHKPTDEKFLQVLREALLQAVANEHLEIVRLIDSYFITHQQDLQDIFAKAFIVAASKGKLKAVQYIAALPNFDVNIQPSNGQGGTALVHAAQNGHLPVVRYLVENHQAAIRQPVANPQSSFTPLTSIDFAALLGQFEVVKYLVEKESSADLRFNDYSNSIDAALDGSNIRIANYLLWIQFKKGIWPFETKLEIRKYPFLQAVVKGRLISELSVLLHIIERSQSPERQICLIKQDVLCNTHSDLLAETYASIADILLKEQPDKAWGLMKFFIPQEAELAKIKVQVEGNAAISTSSSATAKKPTLLPRSTNSINADISVSELSPLLFEGKLEKKGPGRQ